MTCLKRRYMIPFKYIFHLLYMYIYEYISAATSSHKVSKFPPYHIRSLGWGKIEGTRWCSGRKRWSTRETILIFICLRVQAFGGVQTLGGAVQERLWSQSQSQCSQCFIECNVALNSSQCIKNERTDWVVWISLFQRNDLRLAKTFMQLILEIFYL